MTLIEVIDSARGLLNEPLASTRTFPDNTSSFWTDAALTSYFNLVQQEVQSELGQTFEEYFVTQSYLSVSAGVAAYSLPTGCIKIRMVEDNRDVENPKEIYPTSMGRRETVIRPSLNPANQTDSGAYYLRGNQIVFTDTPTFTDTCAIRMHYIKVATDLTAASSISDIPTEHHRVLVWGIVKHALFQQQADTTLVNAEYERCLIRMRQQAENRQIQRPRKVSPTKGVY